MRDNDRFLSRQLESDYEAHLTPEANSTFYYSAVKRWMGLGWLFPAIGVPILMISIVFASTQAEDAWVLQNILPAFIIFSLLLGVSLAVGQSRLAELNAAIALGVLAIIPSVKYGFVYDALDALGHYATAVEIARTGSLAGSTYYSEGYAGTPLMHILPAVTGLTAGLPIETVIAFTLFLEHFVIFLLVVKSAQKMFPDIEKRLIIFLAVIVLPVLPYFTGTAYGLLPVAMLTYVFSTMWRREEVLLTTTLMFSLVFSHFVTTLYFLIALAGFAFSLVIMRRFGTWRGDGRITIFPSFFTIFLVWLVYLGPNFLAVVRYLILDLFQVNPLPSAAKVPFIDVVQTILYENARFVFSGLMALVASSVSIRRYRITGTFVFFWWLLVAAVLMGGTILLGYSAPNASRFASYASLVTPYFVCFLISRKKNRAWLLDASQLRLIKVAMFAALIVSMVAVYPVTPLYPKYAGEPVLEDNLVNSIYVISGVSFFSSFYAVSSFQPVVTTPRIFFQMSSLHPELTHLDSIRDNLENVTSPTELSNQLVLFDMGRSGPETFQMRMVVLPLLSASLKDRLGVVYSNGFFYVAVAP